MQDATPLTLGRNGPATPGMLTDNLERIEDALKGVYRLALGGTAVGTGINSAPALPRRRPRRSPNSPSALRQRAEQVHRSGRARRAGTALGHAPHAGGLALQNRERHPPDVLRPARRIRRTENPGERTGFLDHARQGQSDPGRGADDDRRAGDGQRRRCGLRRSRRLSGNERLQATDDLQHHAVRSRSWPMAASTFASS